VKLVQGKKMSKFQSKVEIIVVIIVQRIAFVSSFCWEESTVGIYCDVNELLGKFCSHNNIIERHMEHLAFVCLSISTKLLKSIYKYLALFDVWMQGGSLL